ncbi:MAG: hypothetical protein Q7T72_01940 [Bacteroidales bacterium]|nr:hypothetical protein [Bacteroidales bacterium]
MKRCFLITILVLVAGLLPLHSQMTRNVKRPKITGVAHAAFFVKNIDHARAFYKDLLDYRFLHQTHLLRSLSGKE